MCLLGFFQLIINQILYQYSSLHELHNGSYCLTLGSQSGNHTEMAANCYIDYNINFYMNCALQGQR